MKNENFKLINIDSLKECHDLISYMDNDVAFLSKHSIKNNDETVKLDCFMMIFCEEGEIPCLINGKRYTLKKGFCAILPMGTILSRTEEEHSSPCTLKIAVISKSLINEILCINKETFNVLHFLYKRPIFPINRDESKKIFLYKELLITLIDEPPHLYSRQTRRYHFAGMFCEMFAKISELIPKEETMAAQGYRGQYIVNDFIMAINADNGSNRSVSYYADMLCYSPKYLSYIVKNITGKSPLQIINQLAIIKIKNKLKHSDMSIKNMAEYFNFPNPSFFCKFFKAYTGTSPLKYRHSNKEE